MTGIGLKETNNDKDNGLKVSEFLNQASPVKKSRARSFDEMKGDASTIVFDVDDEDDDDEGLAVKLERIKEVTEKGAVSKRFSKRKRK